MKSFYDKVETCDKIEVNENKLKYVKNNEFGLDVTLVGFDKDGNILAVSHWDWEIIRINKDLSIEELGRVDYTLRDIKDNPELLLDGAKLMSLREVEEKLGHKVIIKKFSY
jgi:hypothetical protein